MRTPSEATSNLDPIVALSEVEAILHRSASLAWARAEQEGPLSPSWNLAHGIHLAGALAASLLCGAAMTAVPAGTVALRVDVAHGLRRAEVRLHSVPRETLPPGSSQLLVMLADLVREAGA